MLYKNTVTEETMEMIQRLMDDPVLKDFFLVGGTSLSLRMGHRKSDDIDLFTTIKFDQKKFGDHFNKHYKADWVDIRSHGLAVTIGRENIDLWHYPVPIVHHSGIIEKVRMLSEEDVGAMKMHSIAFDPVLPNDFMDIYQLLERKSLDALTKTYEKKYPDLPAKEHARAIAHVEDVKSKKLILFDQKVTWEKVEKRMKQAVLFPNKVFRQGRNLRRGLTFLNLYL
jgi:hypothetical protein